MDQCCSEEGIPSTSKGLYFLPFLYNRSNRPSGRMLIDALTHSPRSSALSPTKPLLTPSPKRNLNSKSLPVSALPSLKLGGRGEKNKTKTKNETDRVSMGIFSCKI